MKTIKRVFFEDHCQDFLWWDIDPDGVVVGAGPFQAWIWVGCVTDPPSSIEVFEHLKFIPKHGGKSLRLLYPVEKIEDSPGNYTNKE